MFLTLLLSFMMPPAWAEPRLRVTPTHVLSSRHTAEGVVFELDGKRVFVKPMSFGPAPCAEVLLEGRMSELISPTGIGPRYHGRLDLPITIVDHPIAFYRYNLVYEYVEGHVMRGVIETDENEDWVGYVPEVEVSADATLGPHTLEQVVHAFDTLERLRIEAQDIQFLVTPEGNAKLIDYGIYRRVRSSAAARSSMREEREALIEGLRRRIN